MQPIVKVAKWPTFTIADEAHNAEPQAKFTYRDGILQASMWIERTGTFTVGNYQYDGSTWTLQPGAVSMVNPRITHHPDGTITREWR